MILQKKSNYNQQLNQRTMLNKCQLVRETSKYVCQKAQHVKLVPENIPKLASRFTYTKFNDFDHHKLSVADVQNTLKYLFMLDSLNFCFWPLADFQYQDLATNVKNYIEKYPGKEGFINLTKITEQELNKEIFGGIVVPLADERAKIMRQISFILLQKYSGSVTTLVESCNKSAVALLDLLTSHFPNFQDHSIYQGKQVYLYKRAQILIGDIWAKFQGKDIGYFHDISELTMFPDYRVPQILNQYGILEYSSQLQAKIDNKIQLCSNSAEQVEIRAFSVIAVEKVKQEIKQTMGLEVNSIQTDWFLWQEGQKNLKNIRPHHRVLTIYY